MKVWNKWRQEHLGATLDLTEAELRQASLSEANLSGAILAEAILSMADLRGAHLSGADLSGADLRGAILSKAFLFGAILYRTNLAEATLEGCAFGSTIFCDVDLSTAKGLESTVNRFPSSIGIDTILKSRGKIPASFLRATGLTEDSLSWIRELGGKAFEFYSCFISYSSNDQEFADRLRADLQSKGVRVWFFSEDANWGETVWGEIDRSIKIYDKLVVLLSENSLQSGPVLREIERALNREDKEAKNILFPIRIDDYVFKQWEHERKADVTRKVIGDFSNWKDHDAYQKSFTRLLRDLQGKAEAKAER